MSDIKHFSDDMKKFSQDEKVVIDHLYSVLSATETILQGALDEMKKRLKEKSPESGWISVKDNPLIDIEDTIFVAWFPNEIYAAACENPLTGAWECPECGKKIGQDFTHYMIPPERKINSTGGNK
jgi:hypothetical protein